MGYFFAFLFIFTSLPSMVWAETIVVPATDIGVYYENFKQASLYSEQNQPLEVIRALEQNGQLPLDSESVRAFAFWKNVLLAEAYWKLNGMLKSPERLASLPPEPDVERNPNQEFYRRLYQKALMIKADAMDKVGQDSPPIRARLWALFPDFEVNGPSAPPTGVALGDKIDRLHVLHEKKLFDAVPTLLTSVDLASYAGDKKCRAIFELGNSLKTLKKSDQATEIFALILGSACEGEWLSRSLFWKGRLEWDSKKYREAILTYELLAAKFPDHQLTDDAYNALWKISLSLGEKGKAHQAYSQLMKKPGDMGAKILFEEAYQDFKKKNFKKAVSTLDKIISTASFNEIFAQALYWKARCLQHLGASHKDEAKQIFERLIREFPLSFYSVLSSNRLNTSSQINLANLPKPSLPDNLGFREIAGVIDSLNSKKKSKEALNLLDYFTQVDPSRFMGIEPIIAQKWIDSGDYNQGMMMAAEHLNIPPFEMAGDAATPMILQFYPIAFPNEVKKHSTQNSLPRGVVDGIMREESLFLPSIRSSAGAFGVMQLMPKTALLQAGKISLTDFSTDKLSDPEINIRLGSSFFRQMLDFFDGQIPLAVMAYNAGPGNVKKWVKAKGHLPLDEFIEEIPFSETKGYVKRVLRSIRIYGALYNEEKLIKPFFSMKIN